ncbi:formyltransferase family protein [Flavivirga rizhaonensis]|uniref:Methionyl-tRNA formyltransferase n=1 Tax=Flavivirga rizhaonensis TaxID=2559571 RepID=A0A4S1E0K5_9FLAO|nr:formyltransferase family protein [Flavivirga rizhaonensis]TGV03845.1 methionyl-tRNA formyltransferase [Flavivirga rizhaonensis]
MKIACITYRDWAINIYEKIYEVYNDKHTFLIWKTKDEFNAEELKEFKPDLILWYGWSWIVDDLFVNDYESIMLHPTPLPKYRGGSPIQNQIINGEKIGAVSLFKMNEGLDKGDIYQQLPLSLSGSLNEIFDRISNLGFAATCNIIDGNYSLQPQDHSQSTYFKRRKPKDSEITLKEIQTKPAEYLHNKIRMLNDPYPNAYISTIDGKKLYLIESKI